MAGEYDDAREFFESSFATYRDERDEAGAAKVAHNLGRMLIDAGDACGAVPYLESALAYFVGRDPVNEASTVTNLAFAMPNDRTNELTALLARAFEIFAESPDPSQLRNALLRLAEVAAHVRLFLDAATLCGASRGCWELTRSTFSMRTASAFDQLERQLRQSLDPDTLSTAETEGRRMDERSSVAYAVRVIASINATGLDGPKAR
jgi:hypothetical protein